MKEYQTTKILNLTKYHRKRTSNRNEDGSLTKYRTSEFRAKVNHDINWKPIGVINTIENIDFNDIQRCNKKNRKYPNETLYNKLKPIKSFRNPTNEIEQVNKLIEDNGFKFINVGRISYLEKDGEIWQLDKNTNYRFSSDNYYTNKYGYIPVSSNYWKRFRVRELFSLVDKKLDKEIIKTYFSVINKYLLEGFGVVIFKLGLFIFIRQLNKRYLKNCLENQYYFVLKWYKKRHKLNKSDNVDVIGNEITKTKKHSIFAFKINRDLFTKAKQIYKIKPNLFTYGRRKNINRA